MQGTEILKNEHRVIEQVLTCLERLAEQALSAEVLDGKSAEESLDFFRHFADGCHHGKEEDYLFPVLEARGLPRQGGPTGVMFYEHEEGRKHIRAMRQFLDRAADGEKEAVQRFAHHAKAYVRLLREHIQKEDHCLFPMADQLLSDDDQAELLRQFDNVEHKDIGTGVHEEYLRLADKLADRFGVPKVSAESGGVHTCCGHGKH